MGKLVRLNNSATNSLNMKFLVLFAVVASASANLVTYPNGAVAPAKTPEVVAAEAAHFAAHGAYAPYHGYYGHPGFYNGYYNGAYAYPYAGGLVAYANGAIAPAKTPEDLAAEAAHFAAKGLAPVVPVERADVVAAREEHLAAHAAA